MVKKGHSQRAEHVPGTGSMFKLKQKDGVTGMEWVGGRLVEKNVWGKKDSIIYLIHILCHYYYIIIFKSYVTLRNLTFTVNEMGKHWRILSRELHFKFSFTWTPLVTMLRIDCKIEKVKGDNQLRVYCCNLFSIWPVTQHRWHMRN